MDRRRFVTSAAAIGTATLAGCTSLVGGSDTYERTFQTTTSELERPDHSDSRAVDEDVFSTYVGSMREDRSFGDAGIWGVARERPTDVYDHLGALTETRTHDNDAVSNHALAVYALGDLTARERRHQCWLWSGFDVSEADDTLAGISIELDARSERVAVGVYAPWDSFDAEETDQYDLDLAHRVGEDGLSTAIPLPDGTVEVDEDETSIGPGGSVRVRWSGTENERYAMGMTCEMWWDVEDPGDLSWTVGATFS